MSDYDPTQPTDGDPPVPTPAPAPFVPPQRPAPAPAPRPAMPGFGKQVPAAPPPKPKVELKPISVFAVKAKTLAASGSIKVPGLKVGDLVLAAHIPGGSVWNMGGLETAITKDDEVQQVGANGPNDVVLVIVRVPSDGDK
jgi:hypothetical protein